MKPCQFCKTSYQPISNEKSCPACKEKMTVGICAQCGNQFLRKFINSTKRFCGRSCSSRHTLLDPEYQKKFYTKKRSDKIHRSRNLMFAKHPERYVEMRKKLSDGMERYMKSLSPEQMLKRRKHMSELLKASGHKPPIHGGNGFGKTKPEEALLKMFPDGIWNYAVKTKQKVGSGYPTCYKLDMAFPDLKFGVEADGQSHNAISRREKDVKKDLFLASLGWTVVRFKNRKIIESPEVVKSELEAIISRLKIAHAVH